VAEEEERVMVKLSDNCVYGQLCLWLMLFITWNVGLHYSYVGISYIYAIVCQSNHLCTNWLTDTARRLSHSLNEAHFQSCTVSIRQRRMKL